ncbi:hypothetical protein PybrP1_012495 [[Pythium] brassicae (nom. inval.)]|nr:hypothetical protein PybrP1_012495 [[Pythium] brassicae (nom. inval.)]
MDVAYDGTNALAAAANGDFPLLVLLWGMAMAAPADLLALADDAGNSLLHHAAAGAGDEPDALHFLLQQAQAGGRALPPLVDARNRAQETPLLRAASAGNLRLAAALLHAGGATLLARDAAGNTPAHHAAARGHLGVLHLLLESERHAASKDSASLGGRCNAKRDVLFYACMNEHKAVVMYLLQRGYDPNQPDADGRTCLDVAQTKDAPWLVDLLSGEMSSSETAPSTLRATRASVALFYGGLLFAVLSTSYFFVWWLAVPLIGVVLAKSLAAFRHRGGGHSHGSGPAKSVGALHPSKRDVVVSATVALPASPASAPKHRAVASGVTSLLKPQPEMAMGIWIAWVALFTLFYVVLWIDAAYATVARKYTAFLLVALAFEVVMLALWARLAFVCPSDPGVIATHHRDMPKLLADAAQGVPLNPATHCRTCLVAKPLRSKHCAKCGVCVARLDHHCTWINRCVGFGNHRLFVVFLLAHTATLVVYVALSAIVAVETIRDLHEQRVASTSGATSTAMSSMDVWVEIPGLVSGHLLVLMVFVWALLALGALGLMTKQHLVNIGKNLTVNEQINWRRYEYLTKSTLGPANGSKAAVVLANPFDRGVAKNYKEFFSRGAGELARDYHAIFEAPAAQGVATVPETHRAESSDVHFKGVQVV